ncbi:hypothetical protein FA13DRAFT_1795639 [Coprinellus micaceus]|uniref:Uncharacterized protein n=1 Tax=Coprinellus micaceus TaxID=71717 RepID=A0A4Y7SX72_COPMI|nr:hypothetical protein FA13DRAFT_1795639 [Coprinellus micaceus]
MGQRHQLFLPHFTTDGATESYHSSALPDSNTSPRQRPTPLSSGDLDRYRDGVKKSRKIPCPYTSFLAGTAFTVDIDRDDPLKYFSEILYRPATLGGTTGHNDDGITVVDITNPEA